MVFFLLPKVPLTIVKSDGGFTYDTSDMAALRQRIEKVFKYYCLSSSQSFLM